MCGVSVRGCFFIFTGRWSKVIFLIGIRALSIGVLSIRIVRVIVGTGIFGIRRGIPRSSISGGNFDIAAIHLQRFFGIETIGIGSKCDEYFVGRFDIQCGAGITVDIYGIKDKLYFFIVRIEVSNFGSRRGTFRGSFCGSL